MNFDKKETLNAKLENTKQTIYEPKVEIMDTTLRDGEQTDKVAFSASQKLEIAKKLLDMGVDRIEVASAKAVSSDEEALRNISAYAKSLGKLDKVEILGFIDEKSIDWIYNNGGRTVNLLAKGSKKHCEGQLGKNLETHVADIKRVFNYAQAKSHDDLGRDSNDIGFTINIYLEAWSSGMNESPDYVSEMITQIKGLGIKRIMLPDTLGVLDSFSTIEYIKRMIHQFPDIHFDFHAHNDYGLATGNTLAAIKAGVKGVHATANSLGERAGNCSLYEIVAGAKDHLGVNLGVSENQFSILKNMVEIASRIRLSPNAPIVGDNVYRQTAGIHAHGDKKGDLYKTNLTGERFGAVGTTYSLGKQAGLASIEMNLALLGIKVDKPTIERVTSEVRKLGDQGKSVTPEDLYFIIDDCHDNPEKMPFRIVDARATVPLNGKKEGYIKVLYQGREYEEVALGDGGYNAIMNALGKVATKIGIQMPNLTDFKLTIPKGGKTDALVEAVIDWENGEDKNGIRKSFVTASYDTDQLMSAVKSTEKMMNVMIRKYGE